MIEKYNVLYEESKQKSLKITPSKEKKIKMEEIKLPEKDKNR
jgi:hypothetical protein